MVGITEKIAIEDALQRAFWSVKVPSMTVLLAPLLTYVLLGKLRLIPTMGMAGLRWIVPTFFVAFVGGWLIWSVQVPRWRLWAYRGVDDIAALKQAAMERGLIWPAGHFFERTELMSPSTRDELRALERDALLRMPASSTRGR